MAKAFGLVLAGALAVAVAGVAWAADDYVDPMIEYRGFQISDEIEVNLFAAEPMIANPIQMTFDGRGRLWVICSYVYPQLMPGDEPHDKLIILEDTDKDGKADKRTVFADGLLVPTGFELGDGGAYVANQPELLFLKDTDGDDVADVRQVVLSGFGTEDNHHAISAFQWGPDGQLYFQSGIFLHTQVETPHGVVRLEHGGIFQWRPRTMQLDIYSTANEFANPWGHAFDRWGQDFLTEGPGGHIYWLAPTTAGARASIPYPKIQGAPKSCGVEFISGDHWPEDWRGDMMLNAFKNRHVLRYKFSEDSSGFSAKEMEPLIVSTEENFRPVDVKQGPDGAAYIADWYNPIIGHMQYNFRDPRRDKTHGRIWRITYKGRPVLDAPNVESMEIPALLDLLKAEPDNYRRLARRQLYERDVDEVAVALQTWVAALAPADPNYEHHRLEALWTFETIDRVNAELLRAVLASPDYRARAAATRVLQHWRDTVDGSMDLLRALVADAHARVRVEAVAALGRTHAPEAMEIAARVLDLPTDRYVEYALHITANALKDVWLPALQAGELTLGGNAQHLEFALTAVQAEGIAEPLLALIERGAIPAERRDATLAVIANLANAEELALMLDRTLAEDSSAPVYGAAALRALHRAAKERGVVPAGDLSRVATLSLRAGDTVRTEALRLAGVWRIESMRDSLVTAAHDVSHADTRLAAIESLGALGGDAGAAVLAAIAADSTDPAVAAAAAIALADIDIGQGATQAARLVAAADAGADVTPLVAAFLQRKDGAQALGAALSARSEMLNSESAGILQRYLRSVGREDAELIAYVNKATGAGGDAVELTPERLAALMDDVNSRGDAARGEEVFRRMECFKCHSIAGAGGKLGPDLNGLGASAQLDYIIESILMPSKAVREGYEGLIVSTLDWELYTAIKIRETEDAVVLRDAIRDEIVVAKANIEETKEAGSLMPAGIMAAEPHEDLVHLVRFVSELGKGAYATPNVPVVRRWRLLDGAPETLVSASAEGKGTILGQPDLVWLPLYARVTGDVRLGDAASRFLYCDIEVTTPGTIRLVFNSLAGVGIWLDGTPIETPGLAEPSLDVAMARGVRRLYVHVGEAAGIEALRLSIEEKPDDAGRAQPVSGV